MAFPGGPATARLYWVQGHHPPGQLSPPSRFVFALAAACRQRHGGKHAGLDYIERQYREDLKAGRVKPVALT